MNIVLINHYAGSRQHGMEYRPYYFAREWVRAGHSVTIVAASESHVRTHRPKNHGAVTDEIIDGIRYFWLKTPRYSGNTIYRVFNIFAFIISLYRNSRVILAKVKPNIVIASSTYPLDIWPARHIALGARAKLVFEVHDLWPLSPIELGGMSRWNPFIMLVQAAEDYAYRHADIVISMLPKVQDYMQSRGLLLEKLHIVPNGIDPDEWENDPQPLNDLAAELFVRLKQEGMKIVGYTGSHGIANALNTLLDSAQLMKHERVAFVLIGDGPVKATLKQRVETDGLDNVWFIDAVNKKEIPALLSELDVAYIGLQRQPLFRFGIAPNKLMDYMMAERPVLMSIDAGNDPVREAGCGLTVEPEDPVAVVEGLRKLLVLNEVERIEMGRKGRAYVLENHTYPVLARRFLNACKVSPHEHRPD